ncbi:FecR family protein [Arenibacter sp. ARW7G5Y1]|uniref:FecR family protein n=1 Tax=Arenibacter sp. ARW7G5Y1 TaxID=2135619 RepID=UPI000D76C7D2|nr:FecR family protein [Arenibacter sp. ARW7G5Y1]PXX28323.1 FecR family protein [Arenibacter sp. ARW7G5Y1]
MISKEIENLIVKYLSQAATTTDLDILNSWIEDDRNHQVYKDFIKTYFAITLAMNDPDINKIKEELQKEINREKKGNYSRRFLSVMKYAAIAIFFIGVGIIWQQGILENTEADIIIPRTDAITLELENGEIEVITEEGTAHVQNSNGKVVGVRQGNKLVYDQVEELKLVYNTLTIPNGKQFNIVLSDGSKVHLNSGSSIKYPINFIKGQQRQVFLTGEAFFEVAHDQENAFIVNAQDLDIQVYGTKFNVSNYPEDRETQVVLVEGSVGLRESNVTIGDKAEVYLKPGYMGVYNRSDNNISQEEVNTSIYTSWMNGNLVFRNISFENIIQKLQRHYNVVIINNNENLADETFNATIETEHETIEQVFNYFNKVYQIEYKIIENKIIIN